MNRIEPAQNHPEFIGPAIAHYRVYGESSLRTYFCLHTTKAERDSLDAFLVASGHPEAFQPGTQEDRFISYVKEQA